MVYILIGFVAAYLIWRLSLKISGSELSDLLLICALVWAIVGWHNILFM